jgi:hypothetical protein
MTVIIKKGKEEVKRMNFMAGIDIKMPKLGDSINGAVIEKVDWNDSFDSITFVCK